ncbi:hypothetical protein [Reyranella sp.]|jgi:hypothetical protein|uniref:hypothetical protein n=1 Tax=Reyranella sp. TaxID=1929291 RepID=UPI00263651C8|nr:hypothetical protein [Reyranella sp.]
MTARTYYDADSTEGRPTWTPAGIGPSKVAERVDRVMAHAFKSMGLPFDDRSHLPVRRYIARMKLTPAQLAMLVRLLGNSYAGGHQIPADDDRCERYDCTYSEYRRVVFYAYRAALSLLVETAPRSRLDLDDLLETLMAWPGALPPNLQDSIASVIGAHVADTIAGRPFKRRALVAHGGAR